MGLQELDTAEHLTLTTLLQIPLMFISAVYLSTVIWNTTPFSSKTSLDTTCRDTIEVGIDSHGCDQIWHFHHVLMNFVSIVSVKYCRLHLKKVTSL